MREGLAFLIDGTDGFRCVGSWGSVESALHAPPGPVPEVLLLDIHLPGMLGPDGITPPARAVP